MKVTLDLPEELDPEFGEMVRLFHPRKDRWPDHFRFDGARIEPRTPAGRAMARLLGFNSQARLSERTAPPAARPRPPL